MYYAFVQSEPNGRKGMRSGKVVVWPLAKRAEKDLGRLGKVKNPPFFLSFFPSLTSLMLVASYKKDGKHTDGKRRIRMRSDSVAFHEPTV